MIKFKNQPNITTDSLVVIKLDQSSKEDPTYAIMFHYSFPSQDHPNLMDCDAWEFKTKKERDSAYKYILSLKIIKDECDSPLIRKDTECFLSYGCKKDD